MNAAPLTHEEQALLSEVVEGRDPDLQRIVGNAVGGRQLSRADANVLRDAIGDELAETGVDVEIGAVGERGRLLDDLIDRVAALSELYDE
jgi:hypothetical protein